MKTKRKLLTHLMTMRERDSNICCKSLVIDAHGPARALQIRQILIIEAWKWSFSDTAYRVRIERFIKYQIQITWPRSTIVLFVSRPFPVKRELFYVHRSCQLWCIEVTNCLVFFTIICFLSCCDIGLCRAFMP